MKKKYAVLVWILCMSLCSACGKQENKNTGDIATNGSMETQDEETDILKKMEEANTEEALLKNHEKIAFRSNYINADGTSFSEYIYGDSDRIVQENEYLILIDEHGDVFGFDNEAKKAFRTLFAGDSYEDYKVQSNLTLTSFRFDEAEKLVNKEEKGDTIVLDTSIDEKSFVDGFARTYMYEEGAIESVEYKYEVDAKSYEITSVILYAVLSGGEKKELFTSDTVFDPETYVVDEQIREAVYEGDMRTATVTENPGTKQEKVYTQTVSKGSAIQLSFPSDYLGDVYLDEACTVKYEGDADQNEDISLYYNDTE